ncbi:sugar transporter [Violaceomyces palustris]|uniref:Sugar transporter n=1 Tax=Violaceomyces palustris TaxID=1673888 RepID=A0ACD0NP10_9BASI|nr:sugar transporter [Violaceomyces palustris]
MTTNMWFPNIHVYYLALCAYLGIFLFGWETGVAGGVVSQTGFLKAFDVVNQKTHVSQVVVAILQAGAFFGAIIAAPISNRFGRKWTLSGFNAIILIGTVLQVLPGVGGNIGLIYGGRVVAGFGIGGITSIASGYVSECSPKNARGRITGLFQIIVALGVMLSYFTNYGVSRRFKSGAMIWRIPFGLQFIPSGLMAVGLLFATESPRWLSKRGRQQEALKNLAFLRRKSVNDEDVIHEMAEINAAVREEEEIQVSWRTCILEKGTNVRFFIAIMMFVFQQWSGQNMVGYYAPQIFESIGYTGATAALLASGIYGVVKFVATLLWVSFGAESIGRKWSLFGSAVSMGVLFYIIGALLKEYPPDPNAANPSDASKAMAALIYIFSVAYSSGVGPVPWLYVSEIFSNGTRHLGLATASATQWAFNCAQAFAAPVAIKNLGYKVFFTFGTINIAGFAVFIFFLPETKGRSLEEMDVIFGSVTKEQRDRDTKAAEGRIDGENTAAYQGYNGEVDVEGKGSGTASVEEYEKDVSAPHTFTRDA